MKRKQSIQTGKETYWVAISNFTTRCRQILHTAPLRQKPLQHVGVSGQFEVVSATTTDYVAGMRANYTVGKCSMFQRQSETMLRSQTYYIAAMEMDWDYSPNRTWEKEMFDGLDSRWLA